MAARSVTQAALIVANAKVSETQRAYLAATADRALLIEQAIAEGTSQAEVARLLGVTVARVRQIRGRA